MLPPANQDQEKQDRDDTVPPYDISVRGGFWYAIRSDGSRVLCGAGDPEDLHAALAVDRRHWRRHRIPLSVPGTA